MVTLFSNSFNVGRVVERADLLVGAVLVAGARAPVLVTKAMVERMKEGSVVVDVAVDQGGCVETIHPTTLLDPVYLVGGVVHYGVANMPALVPRTSTFALTNATLPYVVELAGEGLRGGAVRDNPALAKGVNVWAGAASSTRRGGVGRRDPDPAGDLPGLRRLRPRTVKETFQSRRPACGSSPIGGRLTGG